jgi:hypothetical protein
MCSYGLEGLIDETDLLLTPGITRIDDMQEDVTLDRVFESGTKCSDKVRWEISDKSDRVIHEYLLSFAHCFWVSEPEFPDTRAKSSEELILCEDSFFGESIEEGGFSSIGISDDTDRQEISALPIFPMESSSALIDFELLPEYEFLISEMALHDLSIGLSLSFRIFGSSTLSRELHTHTIDTRSHMLDGGEFDLELGLR